MSPKRLSEKIADDLYSLGVREVVFCPGGRCASLLNIFLDSDKFDSTSFYDERSAGFYALGRSIETNAPVVVLTTSGSAAVELYPALLEAQYQGAKLIALTADRPVEQRGTGAPQTINQKNIFLENGIPTVEIVDETYVLEKVERPLHINVCLEDPNPTLKKSSEHSFGSLLVISSLKPAEKNLIKEKFRDYEGVLILEPLSNLSRKDFPLAKLIKYVDLFIEKAQMSSFDKVIRLGGVPVFKGWRDLSKIDAYYWSQYDFPGGVDVNPVSLDEAFELVVENKTDEDLSLRLDSFHQEVDYVLSTNLESEVSLLKSLAVQIPEDSKVFIGNSLPIREWCYVDYSKFINLGQRGVNGIDGSLAFALGQISEDCENWIVLGDLTTLYNVNDFQVLESLKNYKIRIVVINNSGGQIFDKIFSKNKEKFVNSRDVSFKKIADLWNLQHIEFSSDMDLLGHSLIEIKTDHDQTRQLWSDFEGIKV